jgi:hypothetical protein
MNHLRNETSPYLQQHANNPVDWYPWGEQALELARQLDRPILLSIGYSACHWCHVMAHESFEDEATAQVMNELFVNIKVDREERPDLDKIYQTAHQLLTRRPGGWPLTMFLNPQDHTPYFGGTYFPRQQRHGLPAFTDLLQRVAGYYHDRRDEIATQDASLREVFVRIQDGSVASELDEAPFTRARQELGNSFDREHGGFGKAPKFPHPTSLEYLLRYWMTSRSDTDEDKEALYMLRMSLHAMGTGGLNDQIGGGFCRYSVDEYWMIPHFEKMLYDNGPLLALYSEAGIATGDQQLLRIAGETAEWAMREMQSADGGYYSTLDADSEGEEGKFYVWARDAVRELLTVDEYSIVSAHYGLDRAANFEGHWHLHVYRGLPDIADDLGIDAQQAAKLLDSARQKLFAAREQRIHPGRDEKILTSWNGLMIRGMSIAGRLLCEPAYTDSAARAIDFIRTTLWQDGRLLATYKDGKAHLMAYLDDYVFLADALLEQLQARWRSEELTFAMQLMDAVLEYFEDKQRGGFYFTADDHEQLIHRPKPFSDDSTPAGNGIAARVLLRLGHLLGETRYLDAAERTLKAAWPELSQMPYNHAALLNAADEWFNPTRTIVVRGNTDAMHDWQERLNSVYSPRTQGYAIPADAENLPGLLAERKPGSHVLAYVCEGHSCQAPVHNPGELGITASG